MREQRDQPPLISILINNYNYGRFVCEAIDSALAQDYPRVEVVVVDDGSSDDSREKIAAYGDRLQPIFQPNAGQAAAFNAGFAASHGEIICLLDADDRFKPGKIAAVVDEYRNHPSAQWCFHPIALFGDQVTQAKRDRLPIGAVDVRASMRRGKLRLMAPATSGLTFQRRLLSRVLPMPTEIRITSDNYLKFVALGTAPGVFMSAALAEQRIHGENAYTMRVGGDALRAEVAMMTALHLRRAYPELRRFADRLFARGISRRATLVVASRIRELARAYFRELRWDERVALLGRTSINVIRSVTAR